MRLSDSEERRTKIVINSIILVISLLGMSQRDPFFQKTSIAERVIIDLMAPIQSFVTGIQGGVSSYIEHYVANLNASKENKFLKTKISTLQN